MDKRREIARQQKELEENQEYIEQMQEKIPEWKRGAVVISENQEETEKKGLFGKVTGKVKEKIKSTEAAQQFY